MKYITIIGGCNMDYFAHTFNPIKLKDSNPCLITKSFGGVGRNICENVSREDIPCHFFTILGNDSDGKNIKNDLKTKNIIVHSPNSNKETGKYFAVLDDKKDMVLAACDESIIDDLTIEYLNEHYDIINNSLFIVLDANLSSELIQNIFKIFDNKKILVEAVSETKVLKYAPYLSKIDLLKVNYQEYNTLLEYTNEKPNHLIISNGSESVIYKHNNETFEIEVPKIKNIKNVTGAGDALMSGIIYGLYHNYDMITSIKKGIKWAGLTCLVNESVYSEKIEKTI